MYTISEEFLKGYDKVYDTLFKNYSSVSERIKIEDLNEDLNSIAYSAYRELYDVDAELEKIAANLRSESKDSEDAKSINMLELDKEYMKQHCDSDEMKVFKFITLTGLSAYFGLSNIDLNIDNDHEFGYFGAFFNIESLLNVINVDSSHFNQDTYDKLLSISRDCDVKSYFDNEYYIEDINFVQKLLTSTRIVSNDSEEDRFAIVEAFGETLANEVQLIVATFKELIAANFGIDPYVGVFTFDKTFPVTGVSANGGIRHIEPSRQFTDIYAVELEKFFNVHLPSSGIKHNDVNEKFSDRQYNYEAILLGYNTDNSKPVYFPYKFLEIVSKSLFTTRVQSLVYGICRNGESNNLDNYCLYLEHMFEDDIYNFCSVVCHKSLAVLKADKKNKDIEESKLTLNSILLESDNPFRISFCSDICDKLHYYRQCVTSGVVLTKLDTQKMERFGVKNVKILQYRIKVCYNKQMPTNAEFNTGLSTRIYSNASKMKDSEKSLQSTVDDMYLMDYSYTFDADKVYARPVFAYKALDALKAQNMELDWTNMLLGRYADGSICRSASGEKIFLQERQVHNIYAGSRSGKGVMCFNIFATAIASQIPIFYLDRKPDTAVILKSLAPNMFAVNGGQYDSTIDLQSVFEPSTINYRIPSYMDTYFSDPEVKSDFIYFRAILLLYSLVIFLDKVQNKGDSRYDSIASKLSKGAIFVFDEFTNFTDKFLAKYPTTVNWFRGDGCYSKVGLSKWTDKISSIRVAKIDLNSKENSEKRNEGQIAKAQDKLNNAMEDTDSFKLSSVYMAQLADCYRDVCEGIPELYRAGGAKVKSIQTFIIGQDIPSEYYDSANFFVDSNGGNIGKFNTSNHTSGKSKFVDVPLIKMINNMGGDYILGYQPSDKGGKPSYLAQRNPNVISSSMLTQSRRCFCYHDPGTVLDYSTLESIKNTEKYFNGNISAMKEFLEDNFIYFKPFLILNNAVVPPAELLQPDLPNLGVSEELENKRSAKGNFSKYKESQYVGQCLTQCNRAGLTWEEILSDNQESDGEFSSGVGFEGYIKRLCGSVPVDSMEVSGDVMNIFVREVFGYNDGDWRDFLADFRPEAMFKPKDFINAIDNPELATVPKRLEGSFFCPALLRDADGINFSTLFADQLGSLVQYYNGMTGSTDSSLGDFKQYDEDSDEYDEIYNQSANLIMDDVDELGGEYDSDDEDDYEDEFSPDIDEDSEERINQRYNSSSSQSSQSVMSREDIEEEVRVALYNILKKHPSWRDFWNDERCEIVVQGTVSVYMARKGQI